MEARYLIAQSLRLLKPNGTLFCSADNKAGGSRLHKIVQQFNCNIVQYDSKHKCRYIQAIKENIDLDTIAKSIEEGSIKTIEKTGFISQAGIYGYDKIDQGSKILLQQIPNDLKGKIADFGCGYGYLLQHILQHENRIKTAFAIDADARSLHTARINLKQYETDETTINYLWDDLTQPLKLPTLIDTIIMNPPFHEGKKADTTIGASFIKTASQCLKRNGVLYMVANTHLPYEAPLNEHFFHIETLTHQNGFKVFKAVR